MKTYSFNGLWTSRVYKICWQVAGTKGVPPNGDVMVTNTLYKLKVTHGYTIFRIRSSYPSRELTCPPSGKGTSSSAQYYTNKKYPAKRQILPRKLTCSLKIHGWKSISYWNSPCLGDLLVFGGACPFTMALQLKNCRKNKMPRAKKNVGQLFWTKHLQFMSVQREHHSTAK